MAAPGGAVRADPEPDAGRTARAPWRRLRAGLVVAALVGVAAFVAVLGRGATGPPLDPTSPEPDGGRALARLLEARGVSVRPARSAADVGLTAGTADTLLVTRPALVRPERLTELAVRAETVVLVGPDTPAVRAVAGGAGVPPPPVTGQLDTATREPGCGFRPAVAAGTVTIGGTARRGEHTCYDGALARTGPVTVLGGATPLTNDALDEEGNAALALRLLGQHERLAWYVPSAGDAALRDGGASVTDLLPPGWVFAAVQGAVAVVLLAVWRARRLGPVVVEPLPVAVPSAETVQGRARLYRRARATGHTAEALRAATRHRLARALGLPPDPPAEAVLDAVSGRTRADAATLLYGPAPADDAGLLRLAGDLDALEEEVGT